jgi:hypothetical protein
MGFKIEFTDKEITPWSGMVFMKQLIDRSGLMDQLRAVGLPAQGSNRGYDPVQLIITFMVSIWCGANRYEHLEVARFDPVLRRLFGFDRMAGHKAFQRYFEKFSVATNQRIFSALSQWFFSEVRMDNYTLDVDSTVLTRFGEQQGAKRGYNPAKPGRASHHPLMAFLDEPKMVANFWLRSGDAHTANNTIAFLQDTFARLQGKRIGLLRACTSSKIRPTSLYRSGNSGCLVDVAPDRFKLSTIPYIHPSSLRIMLKVCNTTVRTFVQDVVLSR